MGSGGCESKGWEEEGVHRREKEGVDTRDDSEEGVSTRDGERRKVVAKEGVHRRGGTRTV